MVLYLISWLAFSYSFPLTVKLETKTAIASRHEDADRIVANCGGFFPSVSVVRGGRLRPLKLSLRMEE